MIPLISKGEAKCLAIYSEKDENTLDANKSSSSWEWLHTKHNASLDFYFLTLMHSLII